MGILCPFLLSSSAIFLIFCAVAASRHCCCTRVNSRMRAYRWPCNCLASAKLLSTVSFSSLVDALAHPAEPVLIHALPARFPHMPCHYFGVVTALRALLARRTGAALIWIGVVLPVALAIGGPITEQLTIGADVDIKLLLVAVLALVEVTVAVRRRAIADHPIDVALLQTLCDGRSRIARIHSYGANR